MGEAVKILLFSVIVLLLRVQAQPQAELSKEGILCIRESRGETALGRWLHCLLSSSQYQQDSELPAGELKSGENSQDEPSASHKEVTAENSAVDEENARIEQRVLGNGGELQAEGGFPLNNSAQEMAGRSSGFESSETDCGDKEKSNPRTEELRAMPDEMLLFWLKLNLAMFTFGKLLSSLIDRCGLRNGNIKSSESIGICSSEDNREAVPEISKAVIVNDGDSSSKSTIDTACSHMIGNSLGSAVGAVFAEVLLKVCNSGPSVPSDKINLLLDSAVKDLSVLVEADDGCSKLVVDFITAFKSTYATMCRIHQACMSYEGSRGRDSSSSRDPIFPVATCRSCLSVKSNGEILYASKTDFSEDIWQGEQGIPSDSSMVYGKKGKLVSRTLNGMNVLSEQHESLVPSAPSDSSMVYGKKGKLVSRTLDGMNVLSEQHESLVPSAPCEKYNTGALATSSTEQIHDSVIAPGLETLSMPELDCEERYACPLSSSNDDDFKLISVKKNAELIEECVAQLEYEVDDASSVCEDLPSMVPTLDALALMVQSHSAEGSDFQRDFLKMYERCVQAQERYNQMKYVKLKHLMKQQMLEEEKIQLTIVANGLMRENIDLDRSKVTLKENRALEEQAKAAYSSFSTRCADELAAGLLVMLATLVYSVRKYSFTLLSDLVSTCQPSVKEPRRSFGFHIDWFYNSLDSTAEKLQAFVCHVSVTGRISFGLVLVAIVTSSLLRRSVASSSQAMPATILIVVLGGVCGFIGKVSVDSLGGNGNQWWVVWAVLCGLHAVTNCFGSSVCRLLSGSSGSAKARFRLPFWLRRFAFHATLVFVLPVLAGLLPFGSLPLVMNDLFVTTSEVFAGCFSSLYRWRVELA